jgi:hypothetical protein
MKTTPVIITMILVAVGLCLFYWQYDETRRYNAAKEQLDHSFRELRLRIGIEPSPTITPR